MNPLLNSKLSQILAACYDRELAIYGSGEKALEFYGELKKYGKDIAFFLDDAPVSDTLEGKPLRNVADLLLDRSGIFIAVVKPEKAGSLELRNFFVSLGMLPRVDFDEVFSANSAGEAPFPYVLDANLGHNMLGDLPGFMVFGDMKAARPYRVFILGGSTADSNCYSKQGIVSWPEFLYEKLSSINKNTVLYCGAVIGYTANQEFLKLARDIVPMSPNLVISYSGHNDLRTYPRPLADYYGPTRAGRPFLTDKTEMFYRRSIEMAKSRIVPGFENIVTYGLTNDQSPASFWLSNQRMMYSLAREFKFNFLGVLQPNAYVTENLHGVDSFEALRARYYPQAAMYHIMPPEHVRQNMREARELIKPHPFLSEYTGIFDGDPNDVYLDLVHVSTKGNRIIADRIFQDLLERGLAARGDE